MKAALRHVLGDDERIHRVCLINRIGFGRVGGMRRSLLGDRLMVRGAMTLGHRKMIEKDKYELLQVSVKCS